MPLSSAPSGPSPARPIAIATVSFATLLLELALTRLFSVVLFYHFAFLAISVALLGLGAGGVYSFVRRQRLSAVETPTLASSSCTLSSLAILLALEVVLHVPVSLDLTTGNFFRLSAIYLACAVPFFFTGLIFSVVFARQPGRIGEFYGADLLGGAAACLAVVPVLNLIGGPNAILLAALVMAIASAIWSRARSSRRIALALAAALALLLGGNLALRGRLVDIVYAKGARRDQPWVLYSRWNAISRVEVDQQGESKAIVIDADASTYIMQAQPEHFVEQGYGALMSAPPAVVNILRPRGDYAIIGPGGGVDVLRALANGSKDVTAIEINPIIANDIMRGRYAADSYHLYERPEVHLHVQDGRSFIRNSADRYDVIQMTLVDTWATTAAGAFALSENNLYTVEAFREYFDHLKPDGIIAITRWEFKEPREALRVVSQGISALRQIGVSDPRHHFLVVSEGELDSDGRPVAVLIKKSDFTAQEVEAALDHIRRNSALSIVHLPQLLNAPLPPSECQALIQPLGCSPSLKDFGAYKTAAAAPRQAFDSLIDPSPGAPDQDSAVRLSWIRRYPYDVSPVFDNAPFFFFTFKTSRLLDEILHPGARGIDWKVNLGVAVLFMLLVISALAVLAFLILPLAFHAPARAASILPLLYFVAVGFGYIIVEIALIQRFVLFLGHPTYALTVVIFLLLLSSGAGSLAARRQLRSSASPRMRPPLSLIIVALLLYFFLLPPLLASQVGLAFSLKLLLSGLLLVPLGFFMGMPFPAGLHSLEAAQAGAIEWAWAMNAASSVLGSVLAILIAIHFGLGATLLSAAFAYLLALLLASRLRPVAVA